MRRAATRHPERDVPGRSRAPAATVQGEARMSDLDFLFAFPTRLRGFDFHLGAGYGRAYLETQGVLTGQFLHAGNGSFDEVAELILESRPRIVGFTCDDANYPRVRLLSERLRALGPGTGIVCGGPAATWSGETILDDCPAIDVCVRHEGESTALELVAWAKGERALDTIRGIAYRSGHVVCRTPDRGLGGASPSLDELPDPYLEGTIPAAAAGRIGLVTSRGCSFPCTYCNYRLMSRGPARFHSVERVVTVLAFLDRELDGPTCASTIPFHDDNLLLDRGRLHLLLRRIAELRPRNLTFSGQLRPDLLTRETVCLLRDAGFTSVHFGVESAVPRILGTVKRLRRTGGEADGYRQEEAHLERVRWAVEEIRGAGLKTSVGVILGCPGETEVEGRATLDFVKRLGVDQYLHNFLSVYAGTELERTCESFGIHVESAALAPLPRRTRLTYPAHRLRLLDSWFGFPVRTDDAMSLVMRLLTGALETRSGVAKPGLGLAAYGPALGVSKLASPAPLCRWLAAELPYGSVVCVLDPAPGPTEGEECRRFDGIPFEVCSLRSTPHATGGTSWRFAEPHMDAPAEGCMAIRVLPFADVDWTDPKGLADPVRETLLLTTDTNRDVEAMGIFVTSGRDAGRWRVLGAACPVPPPEKPRPRGSRRLHDPGPRSPSSRRARPR